MLIPLSTIQGRSALLLPRYLFVLVHATSHSLLFGLLSSKLVEDLLERRLRDAVFANAQLRLHTFHERKHLRELELIVRSTQLEPTEIVLALDHYHVLVAEILHQEIIQGLETSFFHTPRHERFRTNEAIALNRSGQVVTGWVRRHDTVS
uniref:Uncharacterized protein n=1 Tax=Globisporangium ultimum (strain ATCC 200006 / CBS 805.95 / DAOM BR144) TaxID=431595 RepID=K3WP84_GLOUD